MLVQYDALSCSLDKTNCRSTIYNSPLAMTQTTVGGGGDKSW